MGWTKRELVLDAYGEIALAGYDFDLSAEELEFALRRLDTMWATWDSQGMQFGYAFGLTPTDTDLDQDSGLPLIAIEATVLGLAVRIAASKGKQLAANTKTNAKNAFDALALITAKSDVQQQQLGNTVPIGAGNRGWYGRGRGPFFPTPDQAPLQSDGQTLEFLGD